MSLVDFAEYKRIKRDKSTADLVAAFENLVLAQILARPLSFLREMAELHEVIQEIIEANRLLSPSIRPFDAPEVPGPTYRTITVPYQDFERLKRLERAIEAARGKYV